MMLLISANSLVKAISIFYETMLSDFASLKFFGGAYGRRPHYVVNWLFRVFDDFDRPPTLRLNSQERHYHKTWSKVPLPVHLLLSFLSKWKILRGPLLPKHGHQMASLSPLLNRSLPYCSWLRFARLSSQGQRILGCDCQLIATIGGDTY